MREFFIAQNNDLADWLIFLGVLFLVFIVTGIFLVWFKAFHKIKRNRHKRGRRRHRHSRTPGSAGAVQSRPADHVPPPDP
jgi:flagellar biosynthesis/type III secretory pathway M-ring protein FliF/YscJ